MRILILADRDWLHPNTGGHGLHIEHNAKYWTEWGHEVSLLVGRNPKGLNRPLEHGVGVHRFGNRVSVHGIAAAMGAFGRLPKADVVLEYINGICWMTPLWLRTPSVSLVHHVHRDMYVREFGPAGSLPAAVAESFPLRRFYRGRPFITVSETAKAELADSHGFDPHDVSVVYPGVDSSQFEIGRKADSPRLVFLGRLKKYKQVDKLIDLLPSIPSLELDVVGDGDHKDDLRRLAARNGVEDRVVFHGHVSHQRKNEILARAWLGATCSIAEGWSSSTIEAAVCGTPTVAFPEGGLRESIVDGVTGLHVTSDSELLSSVRTLIDDVELRTRLSRQARERALELSWERSASSILEILSEAAGESGASGS